MVQRRIQLLPGSAPTAGHPQTTIDKFFFHES
jgi:hypothetical protein